MDKALECQVREITEFAEYIGMDKKAVEQTCQTNYSNAIMEETGSKEDNVWKGWY